jgi:hypothetical protein
MDISLGNLETAIKFLHKNGMFDEAEAVSDLFGDHVMFTSLIVSLIKDVKKHGPLPEMYDELLRKKIGHLYEDAK